MASSPTKRTLDYLRREGWVCQVVEYWNPFARRRIDFLGGIDIIAIRGQTTLGVQATTAANRSARLKKLKELSGIRAWIAAGNEMWVMDWRKSGRTHQLKITPLEI